MVNPESPRLFLTLPTVGFGRLRTVPDYVKYRGNFSPERLLEATPTLADIYERLT